MKTAGGFVTCVALLIGLVVIFMSTAARPAVVAPMYEPLPAVLWHHRVLDLVGQLLMILAGTFGVLVLVKERMQQ